MNTVIPHLKVIFCLEYYDMYIKQVFYVFVFYSFDFQKIKIHFKYKDSESIMVVLEFEYSTCLKDTFMDNILIVKAEFLL